jgi:hypothetical protein
MKKSLRFLRGRRVLFLLFLFLSHTSYSQLSFAFKSAEAGFSISPSNFLGDLGGNYGKGKPFLKDNNISNTKIMLSGQLSVFPREWLGLRLSLSHGTIAGDDALIESKGGFEEARKVRNQNFKSKINEAFLSVEIYPTVFLERDPSIHARKIRPYILVGGGVFHFNPQGRDPLNNNWVYLKGLHTEGQGFPEYPDRKNYKLTQLEIPLGFGIKYFISEKVSLSTEFVSRKTFTDYIDDVSTTYIDKDAFYTNLPLDVAIIANRMYDKSVSSASRNGGEQRGSPKNLDAFYSAGLKLSIRLGNGGTNGGVMRCPVIRQ